MVTRSSSAKCDRLVLGNGSGHGANHDALYRWIKSESFRPVQYEGGGADTTATDIICPMYARVDEPALPGCAEMVHQKMAFATWRDHH
ncbi:glycoside hydrolase family 2 TIM barrel-domain containing protein [Escherichia coli]